MGAREPCRARINRGARLNRAHGILAKHYDTTVLGTMHASVRCASALAAASALRVLQEDPSRAHHELKADRLEKAACGSSLAAGHPAAPILRSPRVLAGFVVLRCTGRTVEQLVRSQLKQTAQDISFKIQACEELIEGCSMAG
jgi:hypothetical protein